MGFRGDGTVDEVTTSPVVEHTFSSEGNRTVSVTAFDTYGNGDTATLDVSVGQIDGPHRRHLTLRRALWSTSR